MKITGACHCRAVTFEAVIRDAALELLDCNCSICSRTGHLHLFIPHADFTLLSGEDDLVSYRFGSGRAEHLFCRHCGVKAFYQPRSHPGAWSVNYHCVDEPHGLTPVIRPFDGRNWEKAKAELGPQ